MHIFPILESTQNLKKKTRHWREGYKKALIAATVKLESKNEVDTNYYKNKITTSMDQCLSYLQYL